MPERYKKIILQRPGQETQSVTERPSETYQLELPDFRIPTVTNSEDSIMTGLANRKGRDVYNQAYNEHLEQHPVSTWSKIAHAASSGTMFPGDASFSNFALDPTNTTKENAHKYAVEKSGYGPQNPNDFWRTIDQMRDETALGASLTVNTLPALITTANGTFGIVPKLAADLKFGYDGYKRLIGPEGWAKTKNFWKEGRYGRAVLSGLGDALDLGLIVGPAIRPVKRHMNKYSKEIIDALKFNLNNKRIGFRMDYPWQVHSNSIPNGTVFSGADAPALQSINRRMYQSPSVSQLEIVPQKAFAASSPMTDAEWDAAYNKAIQSGDMTEVQKLRDLHFISKAQSPILENNLPLILYRGERDHNPRAGNVPFQSIKLAFSRLKPGKNKEGVYLTTDKKYARQFTGINSADRTSNQPFLNFAKDDFLGSYYGNAQYIIKADIPLSFRNVKLNYLDKPYDAIVGHDYEELSPRWYNSQGDEYIIKNPSNLKLSDPITYDDSGQIIPLSKRDDFTNPDIRYGYASPTATKGSLKQLDNFIEYDVFPRLQRAGHNVTYDKTTMPTLRQFDPVNNPMDKYLLNNDPIARNSQGMFHSATNTAMTIAKPSEADYGLLAHEIPGHAIRYNIHSNYKPVTPEIFTKVVYEQPLNKTEDQILLDWNNADQLYTPVEESLLKTSYEPFFKGGEAEGKLHDYGAVNTQLRAITSQRNNYAVDTKLDTHIDNLKDVELLKMLLEQPYTKNGTTQILKDTTGLKYLGNLGDMELTNILSKHPELSRILKRIKDTMKYVAGVSAVGIGMNNISQKQE